MFVCFVCGLWCDVVCVLLCVCVVLVWCVCLVCVCVFCAYVCLCVLFVPLRVELRAWLCLCMFNVIVWFVRALVCDGVCCVCACVFSCVLFVRLVLLCLNLFVSDCLRCVV